MQETSTFSKPSAPAASKSKPRKRVNTAEKRHQHNAIERQRRETLNSKFLSLAKLLPALASSRRPSKSAIVNGSIAHLKYQRDQRLLAAKLLRRLAAEHDQLLAEVNEWRKGSGYAPKDSLPTWTEEMEDVCAVEKEVFGNFAAFDGDDNENDDDDVPNEILENANRTAAHFTDGLVTPRSSTELDSLMHAQALYGGVAMPADKRHPSVNGLNWSHDFAFSVGANPMTNPIASASSSLPFGSFVSDSLDVHSNSSPANSATGYHAPTPPKSGDIRVFNRTPSPRSSQVIMEDKVATVATPQVRAGCSAQQQMLYMQQHVQQQHQHQRPHQQHQQQLQRSQHIGGTLGSMHARAATTGFNPASNGMFSTMFPQPAQVQSILSTSPGNAPAVAAASVPPTTSDAFTQSLLASMFPQQSVSAEQVEQWRKLALAGMPQQQQPCENRHGGRPSSGGMMNLEGMWENRALKGY